MKKGLYLALILIIFGLSYLKWQAWNNPAAVEVVSSPTPTPIIASPSYSLLVTPYFSLDYPDVATSSPSSELPDSTTWSIRYMGQNQQDSGRTQAELFDGYAISITVFPSVVGDDPESTQAETDRQGTIDGCGDSSVTKITNTLVAGQKAISFSGGCLGEAINYYFTVGSTLYRITTIVVGAPEDTFDYQQTVNGVLTSLKFIEK